MRVYIAALVQRFHVETFRKMAEMHSSFECVLTTGWYPKDIDPAYAEDEIARIFPHAYHVTTDAIMYPSNIYQLKASKNHLNNEILSQCKEIESLFYRLTDRANIHSIPVAKKRQMYLILLNYMLDLFDQHPFDLVVTLNYPHSFFEIIGVELARIMGKKIIKLSWHTSQNYSLITSDFGYPELPAGYADKFKDKALADIELPIDLENALAIDQSLSKDFEMREKRRQKLMIKDNWSGRMKIRMRLYKKILSSLVRIISPALLGTKSERTIEEMILSDYRSDRKYRWKIIRNLREITKLHLYYNRISEKVNTDEKYVFFALHMQPEQTTLPFGGEFDDHLPAIEMLSEALPKGWKLYVKEHPEQFRIHRPSNGMFRSKAFYDRIQSLPNTHLLSLEHDPKELIRKAACVSTITGTVGWEALKIGKPVIIFADFYYSSCESAFVVNSVQDCENAFDKMSSLDKETVRKHLAISQLYLYESGQLVRCAAWEEILHTYDDSYDEQTTALAKKIIELQNNFSALGA